MSGEPPHTVRAAIRAFHHSVHEERVHVTLGSHLKAADLLDVHLGHAIVSAESFHPAGRDAEERLELRLANGDVWVTNPRINSSIYWTQEKEDTYRYVYRGDWIPFLTAADNAGREHMSERGEFHPYADDESDGMGFDLFG